ncbi:MAG: beta-L-arabinofuranosidase domain-containing protein, partial [Turicibacter sp.]
DQVFSGNFVVENFSLNGYWVPWYSIHKLYAGLIDAYRMGRNQEALIVVTRLADWAYEGLKSLTEVDFERMLRCEYGGMNEVMADLYEITGHERYLELAIKFTQKKILNPLIEECDELQGQHANTQIPKIIGAAKLYEVTHEEAYFKAVKFFFHTVTENRSFVIGGNSNSEHFGVARTEVLSRDAAETCNTYNMLKLAEFLFRWTKESMYMDYYERALYNHILASQDPQTGAKTYFTSNYPGHFKVYGSLEDSFWCCTGSGMENPSRYNRGIYYHEENTLYLNLFIASTFECHEEKLKVTVDTKFPYSDRVVIRIAQIEQEHLILKVRVPYWTCGKMSVRYGNKMLETDEQGYLTLDERFKKDDEIYVTIPMGLREYISMDDFNKVVFMYGPIVLAGQLGIENFPSQDIVADHLSLMNHPKISVPTLVTDETDLNRLIQIDSLETLTFKIIEIGQPGDISITLKPFYSTHHERYTIYWNKYTIEAYENLGDLKLSRDDRLFDATIDVVRPGEQQSEIEHHYQGVNSYAGYLGDVDMWWRDARGVDGLISYDLAIDPTNSNYLNVTYYGHNGHAFDGVDRTFDILVNDCLLKRETLIGTGKPELVDIMYPLDHDLLKQVIPTVSGKFVITITFKNLHDMSVVGGILEVRTMIEG